MAQNIGATVFSSDAGFVGARAVALMHVYGARACVAGFSRSAGRDTLSQPHDALERVETRAGDRVLKHVAAIRQTIDLSVKADGFGPAGARARHASVRSPAAGCGEFAGAADQNFAQGVRA
jgi:hypothetical protein